MRSPGYLRRRQFLWLIRALLVLSVTVVGLRPARALEHGERHRTKQQIVALEEQWRKALLSSDVASMDHLLSDNYVGISMGGQVNTKSQQLERLRRHTLALRSIALEGMRVKLIGQEVAVVVAKASVEGTNGGRNISGAFRYTRVYQRLPSGSWKITHSEITRISDPSAHAASSRAASQEGRLEELGGGAVTCLGQRPSARAVPVEGPGI